MSFKFPLATSSWDLAEVDAMHRVIASGRFTMGPEVAALERDFAAWVGSGFCVMVNSGSSANLAAALALANPIASDLSDMRPSLLPGLVAAVQANINRGTPDVALFEVGQVFRGDRPEDQLVAASGVRHGYASSKGIGRHWTGAATADAMDAKADAFAVLAAAGAPVQADLVLS